MARDDQFLVRHRTIPALSEGVADRSIMNVMGAGITVDLLTQFILSGFAFHIQTGTEDAPITTNGPLDDTKPTIIVDVTSGAVMPLKAQVKISALGGATLAEAMLEADMDKNRYTSGGQVYVPEQMNKAATSADAANGTFYTIESADIVAAAKSAVPASIELSRLGFTENALADTIGYPGAWSHDLFNARRDFAPVLTNPGALLLHFGSATADVTGYASLEFAQYPASLAW